MAPPVEHPRRVTCHQGVGDPTPSTQTSGDARIDRIPPDRRRLPHYTALEGGIVTVRRSSVLASCLSGETERPALICVRTFIGSSSCVSTAGGGD